MSFPDLRTFLDRLRRDGDLVTVESQVDPYLEVAEIHRRVVAGGGPALLFTNVKGSDFRLVTNLFGTARRAEMAFGERPLRLIRRLVELVETIMPPTPGKLWGARDVGLELLKVGTRRVQAGPVAEVVTHDVRLDRLPALKGFESASLQINLCFDLRDQSRRIEQITNTQATPADLVLIGRADSSRGGSDLSFTKACFHRRFHSSMVGKDQMASIGDEQAPLDGNTCSFEGVKLFNEGQRVKDYAATDHACHILMKDA